MKWSNKTRSQQKQWTLLIQSTDRHDFSLFYDPEKVIDFGKINSIFFLNLQQTNNGNQSDWWKKFDADANSLCVQKSMSWSAVPTDNYNNKFIKVHWKKLEL